MSDQMVAAVETLLPFEGYGGSLTHFFLQDTAFGANVAHILGCATRTWTRWLVRARAAQKKVVHGLLTRVLGARRRRSFVAQRLVQAMILLKRPDGRAPFAAPEKLASYWRVADGA